MANSAALKLAGITKNTPDPSGGEIEKDKTTGEPTGLFAEAAQQLVSDAVPPWPFDLRVAQLKKAMALFNSFGLTSAVSGAVNPRDLSVYQYIRAHNEQTTCQRYVHAHGRDDPFRVAQGLGEVL
jgi:predicted amidohydrolase YtcJ